MKRIQVILDKEHNKSCSGITPLRLILLITIPMRIIRLSVRCRRGQYCSQKQKHPISIDLKPSRSFLHCRKTYMYGDQLLLQSIFIDWQMCNISLFLNRIIIQPLTFCQHVQHVIPQGYRLLFYAEQISFTVLLQLKFRNDLVINKMRASVRELVCYRIIL